MGKNVYTNAHDPRTLAAKGDRYGSDPQTHTSHVAGPMITRRRLIGSILATAYAMGLASCGLRMNTQDDDTTTGDVEELDVSGTELSVAVAGEPNSLILHEFCVPYLEERGLTLKMALYKDIEQATKDIGTGRVDCGYLHSKSQLNRMNAQNPTGTVPVAAVHYEPFGAYSHTFDNMHTLPKGTHVGMAQDLTRGGHSLVMLAQEQVITLTNNQALASRPQDVIDNPLALVFEQMPAEKLVDALDRLDVVMIPPDVAFPAGLNASDAIVIEANDNIAAQYYGQSLAASESMTQDVRVQALLACLRTQACGRYLQSRFGQNVLQIVSLID